MGRLRLFPNVGLNDWLNVWSKCYSDDYVDADYYEGLRLVGEATNTPSLQLGVRKLFKWKNGDRENPKTLPSVQRITFEDWRLWLGSDHAPQHFGGTGIWNIFLLHLLSAGKRPIFDQHTWRAYCWIVGFDGEKLHDEDVTKSFKIYEPWFNKLSGQVDSSRKLDKALMAFGQFLKSQFVPLMEFEFSQNIVREIK